MNNRFSPTVLLAALAWSSLFALLWLVVLGFAPKDVFTLVVWLFFLVVAFFCSANLWAAGKPRKP